MTTSSKAKLISVAENDDGSLHYEFLVDGDIYNHNRVLIVDNDDSPASVVNLLRIDLREGGTPYVVEGGRLYDRIFNDHVTVFVVL